MKIVLTGANGFIGSNLCNYLSKKYQILALSRNASNIHFNENLKYLQYNLENIEDFNFIMKQCIKNREKNCQNNK